MSGRKLWDPTTYVCQTEIKEFYRTLQSLDFDIHQRWFLLTLYPTTCELKSIITMEKAAFNKDDTLSASKLDWNLKNKLVICYIWIIVLYDAESWTLRKLYQKYRERL